MNKRSYFAYSAPQWLAALYKLASGFVALSGAVVLVGWLSNMEALIRIRSTMVAVNPLTAICFVALGSGLFFAGKPKRRRTETERRAVFALAIAVTMAGAIKLIDFCVGLEFHIDKILFASRLSGDGIFPSSEMAPNTALALLLCGLSLLIFDFETARGFRPAQVLVLFAGSIGLLAMVGYSYRELLLYSVRGAIPMALGTAITLLVFCIGSLVARPRQGFMTILTSPTTGGSTARRLLPAAILIPWVIGAILLGAEQKGYFNTDSVISILAIASILIFTSLTWWNAKLLYRADSVRAETERRLAVQHGATRVLADSTRLDEASSAILQKICEILGWQVGAMWIVEDGKTLKCIDFWSDCLLTQLEDFESETRRAHLAPGEGLPGSVWIAQQPVWVRDVQKDTDFPRATSATKAGLHGAFAFPILSGTQFFGVVEFFSRSIEKEDRMLMEIVLAIGSQIGQFIERTRAEQNLREATANLERSNSELQQFAYVASHDLNEPLRMISSYLYLLRERGEKGLDAQSQEFIGFAMDGAQRLRALISDLLAYSRLEFHGKAFESTNAEQIFQTVLQNLKIAIEENHARIEHDPLPTVQADPVQLTQVFQNLVGNAIKFHGAESPHIQVRVEQKGKEWLFSVRDNGIGIDPQHFERIFVIFQRLHTRQEYSGTGMGLAICKKIIERHGGRLWVESAPQKSSCFYFTLPVAREQRRG